MSFKRQMERATMGQQLAMVEETVNALDTENTNLKMELRSIYRAVGAMVAVNPDGEVRIPLDKIDELLKGMTLQSDKDEATNDIVFRLVAQEIPEEAATK
jgi:hypothetical protein